MGNSSPHSILDQSVIEPPPIEGINDFRTPDLLIISRSEATHIKRSTDPRFNLRVPSHWKPPIPIHPHATAIGEETIKWIANLGCKDWQINRLIDFQSSHYVGIPFPTIADDSVLLISKFLSLWLLWDDVEIESGKGRWRIETRHVLANTPPPGCNIYDLGWFKLLQEIAKRMSSNWVNTLIQFMFAWDKAARYEARVSRRYRNRDLIPTFAESLLTRINTIGMYSTAHLVEYASGNELPADFHHHPITQRMKTLSGVIVGLGNEIFSFAKDYATTHINIIAVLAAESGISLLDSFAKIIALHNASVKEYDDLESRLPALGPTWDAKIQEWTQLVRYCSLGFTVWELAPGAKS